MKDLELISRRAERKDLEAIVSLLFEDEFGQTREGRGFQIDSGYIKAFLKIDSDPNQYLMVVENQDEIVATCHLSLLPSLTFKGATRMQIEAVRVAQKWRGHGIGGWMMKAALQYAQTQGANIIQLTTNKKRSRAKTFYEKLGFEATHEGMKYYRKFN